MDIPRVAEHLYLHRQETAAHAIGAVVGGVIGGPIGTSKYKKQQRWAGELIEEIEELTRQ